MLIAVRSTYTTISIKNPFQGIEQVWALIDLNHHKVLIGGIYIPPCPTVNVFSNFSTALNELLLNYPGSDIIIAGDFNLPNVSWSNSSLGCNVVFNQQTLCNTVNCANLLSRIVNSHNLLQYNYIVNCNNYCLDYVFSSLIEFQVEPDIDPLIDIDCHHPPLHCNFNFEYVETPFNQY